MNIDFTKTGTNTAQISLTIEPQDYKDKLEKEIKTHQKQTNMKGFRKGKTPRTMIVKMYGASLLADIVTKELQDGLSNYLDEQKIGILGQPLPLETQDLISFEVGKDKDYVFDFELGLLPEFELPEFTEPFHYYDAVIEDEAISRELEVLQRRGGHQDSVESDFEDDDILTFNGWELEEGDLKKDGLEINFEVMFLRMTEDLKAKLANMKVGEKLDHNIYEVENEFSEEDVRKYFMELDEEDADRPVNSEFRLEVVGAIRRVLAELDEEFLTNVFGEEVKTEEEARQTIREQLKNSFDVQADNILFQKVHDQLREETVIDLPEEFLKRWLKFNQRNNESESPELTDEEIEDNYHNSFESALRWQLISEKLAEKYEVTVEQGEILDALGNRIQQYMPGQQLDPQVYNQILQSLAQDKDQVQQAADEVRTNKIFYGLKEELELDREEISQSDFNDKLMEISKESAPVLEDDPLEYGSEEE